MYLAYTFHFVYVIRSRQNASRFYVGYSKNPIHRLYSHNEGTKRRYTMAHRPWVLIYVERLSTKCQALNREKQLKSSRGRAWIKQNLLL